MLVTIIILLLTISMALAETQSQYVPITNQEEIEQKVLNIGEHIEKCKKMAEKDFLMQLEILQTTEDTAAFNLLNGAIITNSSIYFGLDDQLVAVEFLFSKDGKGVWSPLVDVRNNEVINRRTVTSEIIYQYPDNEIELTSERFWPWLKKAAKRGYKYGNATDFRHYYFGNVLSHFFTAVGKRIREDFVVDLYNGYIQSIVPEWKTLEDLKKNQVTYDLASLGKIPRPEEDETQTLKGFLQQKFSNQEITVKIKDIFNRSQVILVKYENCQPIRDKIGLRKQIVLAESLKTKGAFVTLTSSHKQNDICPGLFVRFNKSFWNNNILKESVLRYMKLPLKYGYELNSVRIVYVPSLDIKKTTFERCDIVITKIIDTLMGLKSQLAPLQEFGSDNYCAGKWNNEDCPDYPSISYQYGFQSNVSDPKLIYDLTTANWCDIKVWFEIVTGLPPATLCNDGRMYPRQGIYALWSIRSSNVNFNKKVSQIIDNALWFIDEFEKELEQND